MISATPIQWKKFKREFDMKHTYGPSEINGNFV